MLSLLNHADDKVLRFAYLALQNVNHPAVRAAALARLPSLDWKHHFALRLLEENFDAGDEALIEEALYSSLHDDDLFHGLAMEALSVAGANEGDWESILLLVYNRTPCSRCRSRAALGIVEEGFSTPELRREFSLDASGETRLLAEPGTLSTG